MRSSLWFLFRLWKKRFPTLREILIHASGAKLRTGTLRGYEHMVAKRVFSIPRGANVSVPLTRNPGARVRRALQHSPQVRAFEAEGVIFEPSSEILLQRKRYYRQPLPRRWSGDLRENLYSASSLISWNSSNFCVYATDPAESCPEIAEGILLNGQTCTNWYHWLINLLPKAFIVEQYLDVDVRVPYLVSESIQGTRMEEALRLVVGNEREVLFLKDRPHKVARGFLIETPVREIYRPKNILSKFRWSRLGSFHFEIMAQYRSHIIEKCLENKTEGQSEVRQRVFLARDNLSRPSHQDEVGSLLEDMEFETIHLGLLPFKEQVSTLNQAKFVISTTGAQWAGWLFSQDAIGLILVPAFLTKSSLFSKLGFIGSSELLELTFKTTTRSWAEFYTSRVPSDLPVLEVRNFVEKVVQSGGFPRQGKKKATH